jgi:excisionase family DNA binding protein
MKRTTKLHKTVEAVRRTVTIAEAGMLLGVGRNSAYEAVKSGQIPVIKIGRRMVVPVAALERLLDGDAPKGAA